MEFDEHEEQEEEVGIQLPPGNYDGVGNSGRGREVRKSGGGGGGFRYRECLKNHAVGIGGHAVDGCGEFMAAGDEGTLDALKCAACNCHRNFHRKEIEGQQRQHQQLQQQHQAALQHQYMTPPPYYHPHHRPTGYLHMTPAPSSHHQRPLALPSTSREDLEEISNPSSSGGGGGGGLGGGVGGGSGSRKRFRTKFTQDQKDRMLAFSETLGWRIQKQDEAAVQHFCAETGVKRHVLKVWMHNNKHTIGKKP
ncbi:unnamed protein product [Lactuca virosa]|uniref:ZF-HD dimerization-type domain-containing protein n=1 Tax=Lactuca virosa TaxID=75947 RepID=A0AAU9PWZ1_9ASTR|nr:unnamed protein product [Lactuca virosa]